MTAVPARVFGLTDRGVVREQAFADLVLLDPDTVIDSATFESPKQPRRRYPRSDRQRQASVAPERLDRWTAGSYFEAQAGPLRTAESGRHRLRELIFDERDLLPG